MIDNPNSPMLGRAAESRLVQILGRHAGWSLTQVPHDYGLPLAACLENQATDLLITVAGGNLALCAAAMDRTLLDARCDALIIADESEPWFPPLCAIGCWRGGEVTWHLPLLPWSADGQTIWLVPAHDVAIEDGAPSFRLTASHLKGEAAPWANEAERLASLDRACPDAGGKGMTPSYSTQQMLRIRDRLAVAFILLLFAGNFRRDLPGGRVTQKITDLAGVICPHRDHAADRMTTIAGGAHVLDAAVFARSIDIVFGSTRCVKPHKSGSPQ